MVLNDEVGRTTSVLAGDDAEAAALEVAIEDDSTEEAALEVATADDSAEEAAGWVYIPLLPPPTAGVEAIGTEVAAA
jgi:hypothetical protein